MSSDEDEEDGLSLKGLSPRLPRPRQKTFLGILATRRKSTGQEFLHSKDTPSGIPPVADPEPQRGSQGGRVTRSQSNANVPGFKPQWADALVLQEPMQSSLIKLRQTVQSYEKQATSEKWGELWRVRADVTELDMLAKSTLDKQKSRKKSFTKGLERFSTVALEYSKLLDVVMNQCPEYVALAWGVTKLLLVANINHSKLKQNVELHLINIGEQLGLVNQLIAYSPTDKMVEAVASLYANFSKFLGKALRCYAKSKLASVFEAFAFPWEAKFQKVVSQIDAQIRRIQELASASHFHATLCNQDLLRSLWDRQAEDRTPPQQESEIRMEIKEELKKEIDDMLHDFNEKWVQRFDELLVQQTAWSEERFNTDLSSPSHSNTQLALLDSTSQTYLADFVSDQQALLEFRDEAFPQLQRFDQREDYIRAGGRLLTTYDWQHCVALLRHPSLISWMASRRSGILWVDTYQSHRIDWASIFSARLAEDFARYKGSLALTHFCQGYSTGNAVFTAAVLIQSLIIRSISLDREQFTVPTVDLTQQRFQDAQNDVEKLWTLFLDVLRLAAKAKCVWIVIDHVDILQKETNLKGLENALALLRNLNALTDDPSLTVKILITARIRDAARLSTKIAEARILANRHAIISVPRGHHRNEAALLDKSSKKISRLPEQSAHSETPTNLVSVDSLLSNTDSDSDKWEGNPTRAKHGATKGQEMPTAQKDVDGDTGESDSASLFDPFASSDDSEPTTESQTAAQYSSSSEDSTDEDFPEVKPFGDFAKLKWGSSDEEGQVRKLLKSPLTPTIVVAHSEHPPLRGDSWSGPEKEGIDGIAKETKARPDLSTPKASYFGSRSRKKSSLSSDSDSDNSFV